MLFEKLENYKVYFYFIFRFLVGLLFFQHGAQKLFGWFGGQQATLLSLFGVAGIIEFIGGLAIALGLFTRLFALISALEMAVAYFMVHFPQGFVPIQNQGELALLYFAAFIVMFVYGAGKWSLENALLKREIF